MKAIQLREPKHLQIINTDEPPMPGPGEALVRVHRVGICGTDISGYLGKMPFFTYPRIPGHELGVEVLAVGDNVPDIQPGQTCSVEPYINDPTSFASRRGNSNCCERAQVLGIHIDGGMRSHLIVPARKLHFAHQLSFDQLAIVETLAIGCHAVNRCNPDPQEHALVIGAGPIGLSVIEFLKLRNCSITVLDLNEQRLSFCRNAVGVSYAVRSSGAGDNLKQLQEVTGGALYTAVFDATGNVESMNNACHYAAHTGRVVFVGIVATDVSFPDPLFHRRELTLLASRNALPREFRFVIDQIETNKIDTCRWITHHIAFNDLPEMFPQLIEPEANVIKAIVEL